MNSYVTNINKSNPPRRLIAATGSDPHKIIILLENIVNFSFLNKITTTEQPNLLALGYMLANLGVWMSEWKFYFVFDLLPKQMHMLARSRSLPRKVEVLVPLLSTGAARFNKTWNFITAALIV